MADADITRSRAIAQQVARLAALCRLTLSAVEDRHNYGGKMQSPMSDVQVSILAIGRLVEQINHLPGADSALERAPAGDAWLQISGLTGILDARAWRLLGEHAEAVPACDLADMEHGLRYLAELAERVSAAMQFEDNTEGTHHA